jgi:hypothetical protein
MKQLELPENTIQSLAEEALGLFETKTRSDGTPFICRKDISPQWVADMCFSAHGDFLPDDYRYTYIHETLEMIAGGDMEGDGIETDIYSHDLNQWFASNLMRSGGYANDALRDLGDAENIEGYISYGQLLERHEVFDLVLAFLTNLSERE